MSCPLKGLELTVGKDLLTKIQTCKLLLVGSGGIGCELLKNLALSGFRHVEVIDLDTIDVSNLNRQFLFRSHHVGKSKCEVASQVALNMIPPVPDNDDGSSSSLPPPSYIPHHGNVCDNSKFNVPYMKQFALVLNALDNVTARRRVNRLCLAAGVPLVEAGTTGYLGQVKVIHKPSNTACYECVTQETQKVYPICTIRSTPSMPVHTIVWAKELYKLLFGEKVEDSMLYEDPMTGAAPAGGEEEEEEDSADPSPSTYMGSVNKYRELLGKKGGVTEELKGVAKDIVLHLYVTEIEKQLSVGKYKTAKKTPSPIATKVLDEGGGDATVASTKRPGYKATDVWTQTDCVAELLDCLTKTAIATDPILPSFDKDDDLAMRVVTASSQLRSYVFGIEPIQSFYAAKGIAGNIIPAIATTNAIIAGLQVCQVFQILKSQLDGKTDELQKTYCRYLDCLRHPMGRPNYYLSSSSLDPPNPKCYVCRKAAINVALDTTKWTLQLLVEKILQKELGFEEPTLEIEGSLIYEMGEGADTASYEVNLPKTLAQLPAGGLSHGGILRVEDFSQDLEVEVVITHQDDKWEESQDELEKQFAIGGDKPVVAAAAATTSDATAMQEDDDDDDEIELLEMEPKGKRKSDDMNGDDSKKPAAKKRKIDLSDKDVIELD